MYLTKACKTPLVSEHNSYIKGESPSVILSSIIQYLIEATGRYTENYAIDLLCGIKHIYDTISDETIDKPVYIFFGIRRMGVDHFDYIIARHTDMFSVPYGNDSDETYRKMYCVYIKKSISDETPNITDVTTELYDITQKYHKFDIVKDAEYFGIQPKNLSAKDYREYITDCIFY